MKYRGLIAVGLATALVGGATGCGTSSGSSGGQPDELTVWLMPEAKENWSAAVEQANRTFNEDHPEVTVHIREQDWTSYLTKFEAQLGSGNPPDVLELGNTQTAKYMANGALLELTDEKSTFDNSETWLKGLNDSCTFKGKLYCVPYYAAARGIIYRKDMFEQAGIKEEPNSLSEFTKAMGKLQDEFDDNSKFSGYYFPGKYWYAAMSYVYDYGGQIAKRVDGKWKGTLDSPQSRKALGKLKKIVLKYSSASKTSDEENRNQVFAEGGVATMYSVSYDPGVITGEDDGNPNLKGKLGAFPMPSHKSGEIMPSFLGGSDLDVPASTDAPELAKDWIRAYTSNKSMKTMVEDSSFLPNTTSLLEEAKKGSDDVAKAFITAGNKTWFVPSAKNWASVEQRNIIPNMLVKIFTEKSSVQAATTQASEQITKTLNQG